VTDETRNLPIRIASLRPLLKQNIAIVVVAAAAEVA
jgi:hypothetical protein